MAKFRMVRTDFWNNPIVSEEMSPEDKYFYLYLQTNPQTTQIGIYKITKKQMAFDTGYSIETIQALMERFIQHHKLIRYNPDTREIALNNWAKSNLNKGGKPIMDCIHSELKEVEDDSLIRYISQSIPNQDIRNLFDSFCKQEQTLVNHEVPYLGENDTQSTIDFLVSDGAFTTRQTIRGQKEEKEITKEKQQEKELTIYPDFKREPVVENSLMDQQKAEAVRAIIKFWDENGFGLTNVHAKQQLLAWLDDSRFLHPKEVILKAMNIACANNKRTLNYVSAILKNWENESLLSVKEIDFHESQKGAQKPKNFNQCMQLGRVVPGEFVLDLSAGEE
ncbi:DnaD domain protein [Bacillus marasmi]|uniref:DnaD domain protein n=1 Tax=Bacillus marasmi TaxID=1926279 RepID=UPI001FEC73AD|nr:DnaD domain protein [Bacillus marasmi]